MLYLNDTLLVSMRPVMWGCIGADSPPAVKRFFSETCQHILDVSGSQIYSNTQSPGALLRSRLASLHKHNPCAGLSLIYESIECGQKLKFTWLMPAVSVTPDCSRLRSLTSPVSWSNEQRLTPLLNRLQTYPRFKTRRWEMERHPLPCWPESFYVKLSF